MSESVCTVSKSCSGGAITALPQLPLENATKEVCVVVVEYGRTDDADEVSTSSNGASLYSLLC
jgi:hypothetical protein